MTNLKPEEMKRGAIPSPKHLIEETPLHKVIGVNPPHFMYNPRILSMWGNDKYGDCVTAEEAFAKSCYSTRDFITEEEVINWASAHNYLNGAKIYNVMMTMQSDGFNQNNIEFNDGTITKVAWKDETNLKNAILKGPVKLGVSSKNFSAVTPNKNGWFLTGLPNTGTEDYHCVSLCGYDTLGALASYFGVQLPASVNSEDQGYVMFTWGSIGFIDVPSLLAITNEAWLRDQTTVTKQWFNNPNWNQNYFPATEGLSNIYADTNPVLCPKGQLITGVAFYQKGNRIAPKIQCSNPDGSNPTWIKNTDGNSNYFPGTDGLSEIYADTNQLVCPQGQIITGLAFYQKGNRIAPMIQCSNPDGTNPSWVKNTEGNNEYFPGTDGLSNIYADSNPVLSNSGQKVIGVAFYQKGNRLAPEILEGTI